ncbi:hypothetical protein [Streptomyces sp. NPDC004830]
MDRLDVERLDDRAGVYAGRRARAVGVAGSPAAVHGRGSRGGGRS